MSGRKIEIVIDLQDATKGKLESLKKQLDAFDKQAQRINNRFKSFSTQRWRTAMTSCKKIREHAQEISDIMAASLSEAVATVHKNQTLCA